MKKRLTLLVGVFACLLWVSSPNTSHAAGDFFEDLATCGWTYHDTIVGCDYSPDPNACWWDAMQGYTDCIDPLLTPSHEEPDFCSQAIVANQICGQTFQGVDEFGLLMECRSKSGIDYCQ
jgi:hypothetical protein